MRMIYKLLSSAILSLSVMSPVVAQNLETALSQTHQAYKVEKLEAAKTIRLEMERLIEFDSHDYSAGFHDPARQTFHYVFDFENQKGSHEYLTQISRTTYHGRSFVSDGQSYDIFYGPDNYVDNGEADFYTVFGRTFRASDVILALWMHRDDANARYVSQTMWLGYHHDIVEIDYPNSPPLRVFVRQKDGAITKMERILPDGRELYYTFSKHEKSSGILVAREHSFYLGAEQVYFTFNRDLVLNNRFDRKAFEIDKNIKLETARNDQSEMAVLPLGATENPSQLVHQVGQGENCTTFMVSGKSVIGFGMGTGFKERLAAYRQQTGITLPLTYVIAADHHDEDIGGAADVTEAGATLMVTDQTAVKLRASEGDHNIEIIDSRKNIGDIAVMSLATDHAVSVLVAYHNTQKLFMQTGHYYSSFIEGPSYARRTAVSLYEAIPEMIKQDAIAILSGQDMKAEKWSDFQSAIDGFEDVDCHRNRPICRS